MLIEGIVGVQKEAVLAAKRSIVTVEEIVDDFGARSRQRVHPAALDGRRHRLVPGGAHPSYAHGYYKRDNAFYKAGTRSRATATAFCAWMKANVLEKGPEVVRARMHAQRASRAER